MKTNRRAVHHNITSQLLPPFGEQALDASYYVMLVVLVFPSSLRYNCERMSLWGDSVFEMATAFLMTKQCFH